jgi:lysyl-tRNA synthetase class 2
MAEVATIARLALGEVGLRQPPLPRPLPPTPRSRPAHLQHRGAAPDRPRRRGDLAFDDADRDTWLELLMSQAIEPHLGATNCASSSIIRRRRRRSPACAADADGQPVAARFELYFRGVELANGYHELLDAGEQRRRFAADLQRRGELGLPAVPIDEDFLAAIDSGLPDCSGVALGLDRLVMLAVDADSLQEVVAFPVKPNAPD